jgi:hypothetical protein
MLRGYRLAAIPPMAPTMILLDSEIAEAPMGPNRPALPRLTLPAPPSADIGSLRDVARLLVAAENPRINYGRLARTERGVELLVELAELLQAQVVSVGTNNRVSFPLRHPLAGTGTGQPDLVLNLEVERRGYRPIVGARTIAITATELLASSNYGVLPDPPSADMLIDADGEASLPGLIEEVRRLARSRAGIDSRGIAMRPRWWSTSGLPVVESGFQPACGGSGRAGDENVNSLMALMLRAPYRKGTMRRRGAPCRAGIGSSFIIHASITCGCRSVSTDSSA